MGGKCSIQKGGALKHSGLSVGVGQNGQLIFLTKPFFALKVQDWDIRIQIDESAGHLGIGIRA